MPSLCNSENNDQMNKKSNDVQESINGAANSEEQNGTIHSSIINGFTEEDIDDELPVLKKNEPTVDMQEKKDQNEVKNSEESIIVVSDDTFNIKISVPGLETFELTVCYLFIYFC